MSPLKLPARVSMELVPRSVETLQNEAEIVRTHCPMIKTLNVPDLLRFEMRSWDAVPYLKGFNVIPHLRSMDFDLEKPFPLAQRFIEHGIREVLVIQGDPPQDMKHRVYPTNPVDFTRKLKNELPELKVYGAFDPFRNPFRTEMEYLKQKMEAGMDGFMSQPFFDLRMMEIYGEFLEGKDVYFGISPVVSESSRNYWETRNRAIFPKHFEPTMEWNTGFAKKAIAYCAEAGFNVYLMPIKIKLEEYCRKVFG